MHFNPHLRVSSFRRLSVSIVQRVSPLFFFYLLKMEIDISVLAHLKMRAMSISESYFFLIAAYTAGSHQFHQVC